VNPADLLRARKSLSLVLVALLGGAAACTSDPSGVGDDDDDDVGDDDDTGDDDDDDDGDDEPACEATGPEVLADGVDNDCDAYTDEVVVCPGSGDVATIAEGVAAAPAGGRVEVCGGTYEELLTIDKAVTIVAPDGKDATFLDANSNGVALTVSGTGTGVVSLEGFTIREGAGAIVCDDSALALKDSLVTDSRNDAGGGGLRAAGCDLHVVDSAFTLNSSAALGGAVNVADSTGDFTGCSFSENEADKGGAVAIAGGAIEIKDGTFTSNSANVEGGALHLTGDAVIDSSTFTLNYCAWIGGVAYTNTAAPIIKNSTFHDNEAYFEGGAMYFHHSAAVLTDNAFTSNLAFKDDGGAMRIFESPIRLERNLIQGNQAGKAGGGFKASHVAGVYIDNDILDNVAAGGGGGAMWDNDSSTIQGGRIAGNTAAGDGGGVHLALWAVAGGSIKDVVIEDNQGRNGGGMWFADQYVPVTVSGLTVQGNTATQRGGGLYMRYAGTGTMSSTLVASNAATLEGGGIYVSAVLQTATPCKLDVAPYTPGQCATNLATNLDGMVLYANTTAGSGAGLVNGHENLVVSNSVIAGHAGAGVKVIGTGAQTWTFNDTFPASFSGMSDPTGSNGNIAADPMFMAVPTDFHLQVGSPLIDAGEGGADIGLYP
jgi:predicted outer membrane repeat protein